MPIPTICSYCGRSIKRSPSLISKHNFCDKNCRTKWRIGNTRGENSTRWKGGKQFITCSVCGKSIERNPCKIKNTKNNFCSPKCRGEWMSRNYIGFNHPNWKDKPIYYCETCNKEIKRNQSKEDSQHHFCSKKCYGQWKSKFIVGDKVPGYKTGETLAYGPNWKKQRNLAQKRDKYTCRLCGKLQNRRWQSLNVHHIRPMREFNYIPGINDNYLQANQLSNLISLCRGCHNKVEPNPSLLDKIL